MIKSQRGHPHEQIWFAAHPRQEPGSQRDRFRGLSRISDLSALCRGAAARRAGNRADLSRSFEMLSVVLGLLAGGCMAGYFSFDYSRINVLYKMGALLISWLFVSSIYMLIFLIMYSLRRAGALQIVDGWAGALLFLATFAFLDGLLLFERWKMGQFREDE